jgi:hypothetical protein
VHVGPVYTIYDAKTVCDPMLKAFEAPQLMNGLYRPMLNAFKAPQLMNGLYRRKR